MNALTAIFTGKAKSHAERVAELASREKEIEEKCHATLVALDRQRTDARAAAEAAREKARKAFAAEVLERDKAIGSAVRAEIDPLVRQFGQQIDAKGKPISPREAASRIATAWRALDARCRDEVGDALSARHLGYGLLRCISEEAEARAGGLRDFWDTGLVLAPLERALRAMLEGASVPILEDALRALDVAVAERLAALSFYPAIASAARLTADRSLGSAGGAQRARAAFDAAEDEANRQREIARGKQLAAIGEHQKEVRRWEDRGALGPRPTAPAGLDLDDVADVAELSA